MFGSKIIGYILTLALLFAFRCIRYGYANKTKVKP